MNAHIKFTEQALGAIELMLATGNLADAKKYLFTLIESGISSTQEQQVRLNQLFVNCHATKNASAQ